MSSLLTHSPNHHAPHNIHTPHSSNDAQTSSHSEETVPLNHQVIGPDSDGIQFPQSSFLNQDLPLLGSNKQNDVMRSLEAKLPQVPAISSANLRVLDPIGQGTNNY